MTFHPCGSFFYCGRDRFMAVTRPRTEGGQVQIQLLGAFPLAPAALFFVGSRLPFAATIAFLRPPAGILLLAALPATALSLALRGDDLRLVGFTIRPVLGHAATPLGILGVFARLLGATLGVIPAVGVPAGRIRRSLKVLLPGLSCHDYGLLMCFTNNRHTPRLQQLQLRRTPIDARRGLAESPGASESLAPARRSRPTSRG